MARPTPFGLVALAFLTFVARDALADGNPATSNVASGNLIVPYDGYLALDGTPMAGSRKLKFELYAAPTGGTALWTETQTVSFYNGRFSVGLGGVTPVTTTILDAEKVYLGISIDDGTGTFFALSGRQAIVPAPYSAWSANSADFKVAGNLTIAGTTQANNTVTIAKTGDGAELLKLSTDRAWSMLQTGAGAAAELTVRNTNGPNKNLNVQTDGALVVKNQTGAAGATIGANGNAALAGTLSVTGASTLTGAVTAGGALTVAGALEVAKGVQRGAPTGIGTDLGLYSHTSGQFIRYVTNAGAHAWYTDDNYGTTAKMTLSKDGDLEVPACRLCFKWQDANGGGTKRYTCVQMKDGQQSGWMNLGGTVNQDDRLALKWVCDGGGTANGDGDGP